jgi:signal transduction histidine kinase
MDMVMGSFQTLGNEIKSLREQLIVKERFAALGEISAGIAHEFRNPMGVITGYARLLLKGFDETDRRREIVQGILKEIEGMNRVMEELLRFSRSEPVNKMNLSITKLIGEVIHDYNEPEHIHFTSNEPFIVRGDETLLKQAINNLLQNAKEAGSEVWINVERGISSGKEGLFISVRDNGGGIEVDDIDKIFMPFYTKKAEGLGIGLSIVQKVAMAHGGTVDVESKKGHGSTFRLFLPL